VEAVKRRTRLDLGASRSRVVMRYLSIRARDRPGRVHHGHGTAFSRYTAVAVRSRVPGFPASAQHTRHYFEPSTIHITWWLIYFERRSRARRTQAKRSECSIIMRARMV
jgi:hypothetical protein